MMTTNKTILITGTSRGIGRQMAKYYADQGYQVAGCSRSPADFKLKNYFHYQVDVSEEVQVKRMVLDVEKNTSPSTSLLTMPEQLR